MQRIEPFLAQGNTFVHQARLLQTSHCTLIFLSGHGEESLSAVVRRCSAHENHAEVLWHSRVISCWWQSSDDLCGRGLRDHNVIPKDACLALVAWDVILTKHCYIDANTHQREESLRARAQAPQGWRRPAAPVIVGKSVPWHDGGGPQQCRAAVQTEFGRNGWIPLQHVLDRPARSHWHAPLVEEQQCSCVRVANC